MKDNFYKEFWERKAKTKIIKPKVEIVKPSVFFKHWTDSQMFPKQMIPVEKAFTNDYKHLSTTNEFVIAWGKRCLHGSTKLKDEETNKEYTIKELAENKKSISVKSVKIIGKSNKGNPKGRVIIKKTGIPFYKGKSKIYKVKTKSGKEILVGEHHRFLSKQGWKEIKELKVGEKIMISKAPNENLTKDQELQRKKKISKKMKDNVPQHLINKSKETIEKIKESTIRYYNSLTNKQKKEKCDVWAKMSKEKQRIVKKKISDNRRGMYGYNIAKGTSSPYKRFMASREWKNKRKKLLTKAQFTCKICDKKYKDSELDVHHKDVNYKNNDDKNLMVLCHRCHTLLHHKLRGHNVSLG